VTKSKQPNQYTSGNKSKTAAANSKKAANTGANTQTGKTVAVKEVMAKSSSAKTGQQTASKTQKAG